MIKLYNTLTRKKEEFRPIEDKKVGMYACGPTVYWYAHIGNFRTYLFEDFLKRTLEHNGYKVKHVMNITDVGHLTSDSDSGEDKLEKGAKKERKTVWDIADFYTSQFKKDLKILNIKEPNVWIKATDTIQDQINFIKKLEEKGFTYIINDGVYFDTSKLNKYGRLWGPKEKKELKGRIKEVKEKKNKTDFALWKFSPKDEKRQMEWDSPWGLGFPGWHTECVVMSIKELGIPFDIHCGAVDHIPIHHTNEIAQAEAAFGKILANFWIHGEFLTLKGGKMSKSLGNIITLGSLIEKGINPLAFRYLCLGVHYRSKLIFSDESIDFAATSLNKLYDKMFELKEDGQKENKEKKEDYQKKFIDFLNDDLNLPQGLALTWNVLKDKELSNKDKRELLLDFDKVFGLNLSSASIKKEEDSKYLIKTSNENGVPVWTSDINILPEKVRKLIRIREEQRKRKEWEKADQTRKATEEMGWLIEDSGERTIIKKRPF